MHAVCDHSAVCDDIVYCLLISCKHFTVVCIFIYRCTLWNVLLYSLYCIGIAIKLVYIGTNIVILYFVIVVEPSGVTHPLCGLFSFCIPLNPVLHPRPLDGLQSFLSILLFDGFIIALNLPYTQVLYSCIDMDIYIYYKYNLQSYLGQILSAISIFLVTCMLSIIHNDVFIISHEWTPEICTYIAAHSLSQLTS